MLCGLKQQQSFTLLMQQQSCQGLVGQLFFASHGYLGPFSWSLRILFLDGTLGMRCWYWGFPGAVSWGTQFPCGPLHEIPWTFSEQAGRIPRMFRKIQRGAQDTPEPQYLVATAFTWPRKFVALFNPSSSPYWRWACSVSNFTAKEQWQTFRTPWNSKLNS